MNVKTTLAAMRADAIPAAERGLWRVGKWESSGFTRTAEGFLIPPGSYTALCYATEERMHVGGETVMSDDPVELRRHLEPVLLARGRVLVTGLGLGCVLRGLLENPDVRWVDVVERDRSVIEMVEPHLPLDRFSIIEHDAFEFLERYPSIWWDFAWHDLWSNRENGDESLPVVHQRLMLALRGRVGWQGAWGYPRYLRRVLRERFPTAAAWGPAFREIRRG